MIAPASDSHHKAVEKFSDSGRLDPSHFPSRIPPHCKDLSHDTIHLSHLPNSGV